MCVLILFIIQCVLLIFLVSRQFGESLVKLVMLLLRCRWKWLLCLIILCDMLNSLRLLSWELFGCFLLLLISSFRFCFRCFRLIFWFFLNGCVLFSFRVKVLVLSWLQVQVLKVMFGLFCNSIVSMLVLCRWVSLLWECWWFLVQGQRVNCLIFELWIVVCRLQCR